MTCRRWREGCIPRRATRIDACVGNEWRRDASQLENFATFVRNPKVLSAMLDIKDYNKQQLAKVLKQRQNVEVDPQSIFDIQVKRLHEYKRQQMNALWVIYKYCQIKGGNKPARPITVLFGAKAAPAYTMAKNLIHLILCLQALTQSHPDLPPLLPVGQVRTYNVRCAGGRLPPAQTAPRARAPAMR